jgi:hypothetical protein
MAIAAATNQRKKRGSTIGKSDRSGGGSSDNRKPSGNAHLHGLRALSAWEASAFDR